MKLFTVTLSFVMLALALSERQYRGYPRPSRGQIMRTHNNTHNILYLLHLFIGFGKNRVRHKRLVHGIVHAQYGTQGQSILIVSCTGPRVLLFQLASS